MYLEHFVLCLKKFTAWGHKYIILQYVLDIFIILLFIVRYSIHLKLIFVWYNIKVKYFFYVYSQFNHSVPFMEIALFLLQNSVSPFSLSAVTTYIQLIPTEYLLWCVSVLRTGNRDGSFIDYAFCFKSWTGNTIEIMSNSYSNWGNR